MFRVEAFIIYVKLLKFIIYEIETVLQGCAVKWWMNILAVDHQLKKLLKNN